MSEATTAISAIDRPITLDDIRHKALKIRSDIEEEVTEQVSTRGVQIVAVGVVAVFAVIGIAYFLGTRAGRMAAEQI